MSFRNIELSKALTSLLRYNQIGVAVESTQILQDLKHKTIWRGLSHEEMLGAALIFKADRDATNPYHLYRFGVERRIDGIYLSMLEPAEERHEKRKAEKRHEQRKRRRTG